MKQSEKSKQLYCGGLRAGATGQEAPLGHLSLVCSQNHTRGDLQLFIRRFRRFIPGNLELPSVRGSRTLDFRHSVFSETGYWLYRYGRHLLDPDTTLDVCRYYRHVGGFRARSRPESLHDVPGPYLSSGEHVGAKPAPMH